MKNLRIRQGRLKI